MNTTLMLEKHRGMMECKRKLVRLIILFMSQNGQSFSRSIPHTSLERPPRCGGLDHLADVANMISCRLLVDDHTHMPHV
jgi:hypothetical protein